MEWKGSPPVFLPCGGVPPVLSSFSFPSRSKCIRGNFTNASSEHFHFRGRRRRHGVSAGVCNRFVGCARRKSRVYPTFTHPCTFARTRLYIRDTRLLVPRFHPGGRKIHLSSNGEYETRITFLALIKRNGTKRDINCLENGGWISWYSSGERGDKSGRRKGERKGRKRFEKMVVRGWKKKKDDHRKPFFEPIYASSISTQNLLSLFVPNQRGSKFNNSRHANPRYEETLLGNLLSVHGCVSIYFIYRLLSPPIRSSSQVDLWISLPVFFTILFESRVTFILARLSGPRAR